MFWLLAGLAWLCFAGGLLVLILQRMRALGELPLIVSQLRDPIPFLSVVIPARNEQANIGSCLASLLKQDYPSKSLEILVVDDNSTDDTAAIVQKLAQAHPQIHLIEAGPLPEGWKGKQLACWSGAQRAKGDWLCFMDADVRAEPGLLNTAVAFAKSDDIDLLTLFPFQEMLGFWERLLMPIAFMSLTFLMDPKRINDPQSKDAMAIGHFILVQRGAYEATGGHSAVRSELLDDVALAGLFKSTNHSIHLVGGRKLVRARMYSGLRDLWLGLTRGATEVAGGIPLATFSVFSSLLLGWMPILFLMWLFRSSMETANLGANGIAFGVSSLGTLIWLGVHVMMLRTHRIPLGYLLLLPLSYTALGIASLESIWRYLAGRRRWKGRFY